MAAIEAVARKMYSINKGPCIVHCALNKYNSQVKSAMVLNWQLKQASLITLPVTENTGVSMVPSDCEDTRSTGTRFSHHTHFI